MPNYSIEAISRNVTTIRFTGDISVGWEQWVLLSSDRHHDSIHNQRKLEMRHLEQVREREGIVLDFGDMFDAMQGKWDPRSSMDEIRPEFVGEDYLDRVVRITANDYADYIQYFALLGYGNHETKIRNKHGTDLMSNLVHRMNSDYGGKVILGGYGGWVRFLFRVHKTVKQQIRMKYHHGGGGGGPVTRGVIQTNRQAVYLPDADIVVNGHTHDSWILPRKRERISLHGKLWRDLIWFVRTPGYKDEYADDYMGFHTEKWRDPRPVGATWMRFYCEDGRRSRIQVEMMQAVE